MNDDILYVKILIIAIVILSTAFHEMAHAYTAFWLGDPTPGRHGRITINPFPHMQPILTAVIMPLVMYLGNYGFMILAQTPIDPSRFKRPMRDHALVAVAGPLMNVFCALVLIAVLWVPGVWETDGPPTIRMIALMEAARFNFILAAFNMLPIPPLDGYWIARGGLPLTVRRSTDNFARQSFAMILCMIIGGKVFQYIEPSISELMLKLLPGY